MFSFRLGTTVGVAPQRLAANPYHETGCEGEQVSQGNVSRSVADLERVLRARPRSYPQKSEERGVAAFEPLAHSFTDAATPQT